MLSTINKLKKDCYQHSVNVVKIGIQLHIQREFKSYQQSELTILLSNLFCVVYKINNQPILNSISKSAKLSRESVEWFDNRRFKVIKCDILLLTQPQHLTKTQ